jgi:putative chitinase
MRLSIEQLSACFPRTPANLISSFYEPLRDTVEKYQINTPQRLAIFLAQVAHESGSLRYTKELASGSAYDTGKLAATLGNTPEADGDGQKYKGRGLIQITGLNNYKKLSKALGVDLVKSPELLEGPVFASLSAGWYWSDRGLNEIADKPNNWFRSWRGRDYDRFYWITIKINGGLNGIIDRLAHYEHTRKAFGI